MFYRLMPFSQSHEHKISSDHKSDKKGTMSAPLLILLHILLPGTDTNLSTKTLSYAITHEHVHALISSCVLNTAQESRASLTAAIQVE